MGGTFAGIGGVARDSSETVVACFAKRLVGSFSPYVAECLAVQEGLKFAMACGLQISAIETYTIRVVNVVCSLKTLGDPKLIISDIQKLLPYLS